jgi:hypothetical protein
MRWSRPSAGREDPLELVGRALAALQGVNGVRAAVEVVRLGDPPPHHGPVGIPVDLVGLDPGPHRRQDRAGEHATPIRDHAAKFGTNPHNGDSKQLFGQRANHAWPRREGLVTRRDLS